MAMVPFYTHFRDLASKETRSVTVRGMPNLPDGEYGFVELYCDEPDCDCRRVLLDVVTPESGSRIWATINYGWESLEFYEKWMHNEETARESYGVTLDLLNPQTKYSEALLQLFNRVVQDKAYSERLKWHYQIFKSDLQKNPRQVTRPKITKRKRSKTA